MGWGDAWTADIQQISFSSLMPVNLYACATNRLASGTRAAVTRILTGTHQRGTVAAVAGVCGCGRIIKGGRCGNLARVRHDMHLVEASGAEP